VAEDEFDGQSIIEIDPERFLVGRFEAGDYDGCQGVEIVGQSLTISGADCGVSDPVDAVRKVGYQVGRQEAVPRPVVDEDITCRVVSLPFRGDCFKIL
jgi:hypothetical protein